MWATNHVLYAQFKSLIFKPGKTPSLWKRCNITHVPKSAMKDLNVPINYRGINFLSCVVFLSKIIFIIL